MDEKKITKQSQFRTTNRESTGYGYFPVRRDGWQGRTRRIAPEERRYKKRTPLLKAGGPEER